METFAIKRRPLYPPRPVGVSIKPWGKRARYWAWGHPTKNNCTFFEAKDALKTAWATKDGVLFHNGKFDIDVAETHMGMKRLPWKQYHDTMFQLFLDDPHQMQLGLKPSAERLLGLKPEERDEVKDWLLANQPVPGVHLGVDRKNELTYWAGYIAYAPGDLVGRYANGDTERTEALFKLLEPKTRERGMQESYDRERRLMLHLLESERQGILVDHKRLKRDVRTYSAWRDTLDLWLVKRLKCSPDLNFNSGPQLVRAMIKAGVVDEGLLGVTAKTRKPKTDKESRGRAVTDKQLLAVLDYRSRLNTCLNNFMTPWLAMADASNGRIFTNWNQTKRDDSGDTAGARTGRLSSNPNFQNIPQAFQPLFKHEVKKRADKAKLAASPFHGLPALPLIRSYIVPPPGYVLIGRDYSQQELRVLAHLEYGVLFDEYTKDPWLDVHEFARQMIHKMTGTLYARKVIKTVGFGIIYGMGVALLAQRADIDVKMAKDVKDAYLQLFPGLKAMYAEMKLRMIQAKPIRTWGGREVYCERARVIKGRLVQFDYKLVNYAVQGSSADCTKEAYITYAETKPKRHFIYLNVHDEVLGAVPKPEKVKGMEIMRRAMEGVQFDIPMLSEGKWSADNWAKMKPFDEKGVRV